MIDLYAAGTSNGMRARIGLEECGLPYKLHAVALDKGESRTPQFLAMNPNGQIPVLVDSEGPGGKPLTLSQSSAILMYCAEKAGKFLPRDAAARPAFLQAYMSASTDVTPTFGALFTLMRAKEPHPASVETFKARLGGYLKVWNDLLGARKYAAGDQLTIADFSLYPGYLRAKGVMAEALQGFASLERWANEMAARPAIQRATKF
jgi:GST-like protein